MSSPAATASSPSSCGVVKFRPPSSSQVDLSFFERLYEMKLNEMKLAEEEVEVVSFIRKSSSPPSTSTSSFGKQREEMALTGLSFRSSSDKPSDNNEDMNPVFSRGILKNVNTANEFINMNKPQLLTSAATLMWKKIVSGEIVSEPNRMMNFVFLSFADLKQYRFTYWLGFPAFVASTPFLYYQQPQILTLDRRAVENSSDSTSSKRMAEADSEQDYVQVTLLESDESNLSSTDCAPLSAKVLCAAESWCQQPDSEAVFCLCRSDSDSEYTLTTLADAWNQRHDAGDVVYCVHDIHGGFVSKEESANRFVYTPGWGLRNVLALLACHGLGQKVDGGSVVQVLCVHGVKGSGVVSFPLLHVFLPANCLQPVGATDEMPKVVGWQANERGKPGPRVLDAAIVMDTKRVMAQWRLWPSLDTDLLSSTKCLLLGAGTLGCAVARTLMGWGVRDITFVDNGRVSYSNPARQSLFEFRDCENKAFKSEAAASRLQAIFPGMRAKSVVMTIPMPGHKAASDKESQQLKEEAKKLDALIQSHDVVFALTDSREARWLPTVQCAVYDKLLINAALGFDSYLVMRHGHGLPLLEPATGGETRLGCYFCMDVTGPSNSQRDRTLDQQCTVTRPGLAQIASGLAAELMVALLHSPLRQRTPAEVASSRAEESTALPHQIRGMLSHFSQVNPVCASFQHCTACSPQILHEYLHHDDDRGDFSTFVEKVCNDGGGLLEQLSGVANLVKGLDELVKGLDELDLSDSEEDDDANLS